MAFVAMLFAFAVLIGCPLCALFYGALWRIFRRLHRKYLEKTADMPPKKWRRIVSLACVVLAVLNLVAGTAGWVFMLVT